MTSQDVSWIAQEAGAQPAAPARLPEAVPTARRNPALPPMPPSASYRWVSLMYHEVVANSSVGHDHWAVVADAFGAQLDWLQDNGFAGDSLEHCMFDPHPRRVAITFDDGYIGQYEHGFRLLAERGMRATFFVTTDWVGRPGFISWDGLREMARAGMSIQSHTVTHPFLSTLGREQLRDELTRSRQVLDEKLGQETMSLALPGGDFPRHHLTRAVAEAGYSVIATSRPGVNEHEPMGNGPRFVDRLTVRAGQPFERFTRQVTMDSTLLVRSWAKYQALDLARSVLGRERYHHWRQRVELSFPLIVRRLGA